MSPDRPSPMRGPGRLTDIEEWEAREMYRQDLLDDIMAPSDAREEDYYDLRANDGEDDDAWINPQRSSRYDSD